MESHISKYNMFAIQMVFKDHQLLSTEQPIIFVV